MGAPWWCRTYSGLNNPLENTLISGLLGNPVLLCVLITFVMDPSRYGKPARLAQQRARQRGAAARCGVCCAGMLALLTVAAMRAGGFSSLSAQVAIDLLSPAPTNGAGAWQGPRLRWAVDLLQVTLVVQTPRILVVALPWLARFGRGRRGALLRSPFVMLLGLSLAACSGCVGRIQLLSQSQAILHVHLLSQAFPLLSAPYMSAAAQAANEKARRFPGGSSTDRNSSGGLWGAEAASEIGCALLRTYCQSSRFVTCFCAARLACATWYRR